MDVEASAVNKIAEVAATKTMIDRVDEKGIEPHVSVWEKFERTDGTFSRSDFVFDEHQNCYICPMGKILVTTGDVNHADAFTYRAHTYDCTLCAQKQRCSPNTPARKVIRSIYEPAQDVARAISKTEAYQQSRRERKKVEILFASLKRILKMDKLRLRGPTGAQDEFLLAVTAQNLRRIAKWLTPMIQETELIPV